MKKGLVDFSDLEHYALDILSERQEDGELVPSDIAKEYKTRFKEVLVDEYQDTNCTARNHFTICEKWR